MLIRSLKLSGLLSFGHEAETVQLGDLNVLIGPNGSGKSNFIEAIGLLRAAPRELVAPIRDGGGISEWLWKWGEPDWGWNSSASIEAVIAYRTTTARKKPWNLRYRLSFTEVEQRLSIDDERLENEIAEPGKKKPFFYFGYEKGRPVINVHDGRQRALTRTGLDPQRSILAQYRDPEDFPELAFVGDSFEDIALYRSWTFGRSSPPRRPQPADLPTDRLLEDSRNLGQVLGRLRRTSAKQKVLEGIKAVFQGADDFEVKVEGGTVLIFVNEEHRSTPGTRLSDGTLRWLSLVAILVDPKPARLICIEEPELGLHPDLLHRLADLIRDASARTQVVITTHSAQLIDALGAPESILVCEREAGSTTIRRPERLGEWLTQYSLGDLWSKGVIGGNRW